MRNFRNFGIMLSMVLAAPLYAAPALAEIAGHIRTDKHSISNAPIHILPAAPALVERVDAIPANSAGVVSNAPQYTVQWKISIDKEYMEGQFDTMAWDRHAAISFRNTRGYAERLTVEHPKRSFNPLGLVDAIAGRPEIVTIVPGSVTTGRGVNFRLAPMDDGTVRVELSMDYSTLVGKDYGFDAVTLPGSKYAIQLPNVNAINRNETVMVRPGQWKTVKSPELKNDFGSKDSAPALTVAFRVIPIAGN